MSKAIFHTAVHCLAIGFIVILLLIIDAQQADQRETEMSLYFSRQYSRYLQEQIIERERLRPSQQ